MANNPPAAPFARPGAITLREWIASAARALRSGASARPAQEAAVESQALLSFVLRQDRAWLLAHDDRVLSPEQAARLEDLLARLASGAPLPYLTGVQEFFGLPFAVTPDVLIPRPETELLVERALDWLERNPGPRLAADVGTGSGIIAVTLARRCPALRVVASDLSSAALRVAQRNAQSLGVENRVDLVQADLLAPVSAPLDLLCANLPYIPSEKLDQLPVARHEPRLALNGGKHGLDLVSALLADAPRLLKPGGLALLEIEAGQGESAARIARRCFPAARIQVLPDLAGLPRLLSILRPPVETPAALRR